MRYHHTSTGTVKMKQPSHAKPWLGHGATGTLGNSHNHSGKQWGGLWWDWTYASIRLSNSTPNIHAGGEHVHAHVHMKPGHWCYRSVHHHSQKQEVTHHERMNVWHVSKRAMLLSTINASLAHTATWVNSNHAWREERPTPESTWRMISYTGNIRRQNQTAVTEKRKGHLCGPRVT